MKHKVIIQPPARLDIEAAYQYLRERAPDAAERWLAGIEKSIESLEQHPNRSQVAAESQEFPEVIRQLIYGGRRGRYRILYVVRGKEVRVLHVRHGAQRRMSGDEIEG
jgi:plasmid stabilization system protein ParE